MSRNKRSMLREMMLTIALLFAMTGIGMQAQTTPAPAPKTNTKPAKPASKAPSRKTPATKTSTKSSTKPAPAGAAEGEGKGSRRDPFESLVGREKAQAEASKNLPPGKAGLQVASLRLDGIVRSSNGMIAVVTNPQARTYFLREGDQLYDGRV